MDKVLIIDDEADIQRSFRRVLTQPDLEVHTAGSGEEGLALLTDLRPDLVIMDVRMGGISGLETLRRIRESDGRLPVIIMTAYGTTQTAIEAMKLGAFDYLTKPPDIPRLKDLVASALGASRQMRTAVELAPQLEADDIDLGIVGRSHSMQGVFKLIGQLAASDATALITGESGTGKELVARAIYQHSRRAQQPFIAINCAAIPDHLLESELFGHERGSFTGATQQRIGRFEQGHQGTLFLDEIGDMPLATQTKILRVLQSGTFERVGGNETIQVNVRVIAATNQPLEQKVAERAFREDLFYRLNVVRIHLPPLRERRSDIPLLLEYFLRRFARESGRPPKGIVEDARRALELHAWPGNVRELENALRRACVVASGETILLRDLPPQVAGLSRRESASPGTDPSPEPGTPRSYQNPNQNHELDHAQSHGQDQDPGPDPDPDANLTAIAKNLFRWARTQKDLRILPAIERELVIEALKETSGNQLRAARLLGITRATLRKRIEKFGIRRELSIQ